MRDRWSWVGIVGGVVLVASSAHAQDATPPSAAPPVASPAPTPEPASAAIAASSTGPTDAAPALAAPPSGPAFVMQKPWAPPLADASPGTPDGAPPPAGGAAPHATEDGSDQGMLGPVLIGGFGSVGFPRPIGVEAFVMIDKVIGFGAEYSLMPTVTVEGVQTNFYAVAGDVRVFPFRNSFFVGLSGGHQHLSANETLSLAGLSPQDAAALTQAAAAAGKSLNGQVTGDCWFINPRMGFLATWDWGLALGIDVGVQIPVSTSFASNVPNISVGSDVNNIAHLFTKNALPTIDLLRVGLMF